MFKKYSTCTLNLVDFDAVLCKSKYVSCGFQKLLGTVLWLFDFLLQTQNSQSNGPHLKLHLTENSALNLMSGPLGCFCMN